MIKIQSLFDLDEIIGLFILFVFNEYLINQLYNFIKEVANLF